MALNWKTACKNLQILECAAAGGQFEVVDLTPLTQLPHFRFEYRFIPAAPDPDSPPDSQALKSTIRST